MQFNSRFIRLLKWALVVSLLLGPGIATVQALDLADLPPTQKLLEQSVNDVTFLSLPWRTDPNLDARVQNSLNAAGLSITGYCQDGLLKPIYSRVSGVYADNPLTSIAWESVAIYCRASDGLGATLVAVDAVSRELSDDSQFGKVKQLRSTAVVGKAANRGAPEHTAPSMVIFRKEWYTDNPGKLESYGDLLDISAGYDLKRQSTIEPFPLIVDPAGLLVLAKTLPDDNSIASKDVYLLIQGEVSLVKVSRVPISGAPGSGFQLGVKRQDGKDILSINVAAGGDRRIDSVDLPGLVLNQILSVFPATTQ